MIQEHEHPRYLEKKTVGKFLILIYLLLWLAAVSQFDYNSQFKNSFFALTGLVGSLGLFFGGMYYITWWASNED